MQLKTVVLRPLAVMSWGWCHRTDVRASALVTGLKRYVPSPVVGPRALWDVSTDVLPCSRESSLHRDLDTGGCGWSCDGLRDPADRTAWHSRVGQPSVGTHGCGAAIPRCHLVSLARQGHSPPVLKHGPKESAVRASVDPIWYWAERRARLACSFPLGLGDVALGSAQTRGESKHGDCVSRGFVLLVQL